MTDWELDRLTADFPGYSILHVDGTWLAQWKHDEEAPVLTAGCPQLLRTHIGNDRARRAFRDVNARKGLT